MRYSSHVSKAGILSLATSTVAMGLLAQSAMAVGTTYTFTGSTGANWSDPVWSPAGTPGIGDQATVTPATATGINLTSETSVGGLVLGATSGSVDIGNGVSTFGLRMENGTLTNPDTVTVPTAANSLAYITSQGAATNIISAPLILSAAPAASPGGTTTLTASSTQGLTINSLVIDTNSNAAVTAAAFRVLQNNLTVGKNLTINGITSRISVVPTGGAANASVNLTNALQLGNRQDSPFNTQAWGQVAVSNITNGSSVYDAVNNTTYNSVTQVIFGQAGNNSSTNLALSIQTYTITGTNTYTGGARMFRAQLVLGTNDAFGTGTFQWGGGAAATTGYNWASDNDARTIANNITMQRHLTVNGSNSLTLTGNLSQSNASALYNLLPTGKTLTFTGNLATDTTGTGRLFTFDGPGKTVVNGNVIDNTANTGTVGHVAKVGTGITEFNGAANTYKLYTAVAGGTLQIGAASSIATSAGIVLYNGGAIGHAAGSAALIPQINTGTQNSTGSLALSTADAAAAFDFTSGALSDAHSVGISLGALPGGVTYTGTITPAATGYRLGGGDTLTLPNANQLTGAGVAASFVNGGTIALGSTNDYTGVTTIAGTHIVSQQNQAAENLPINNFGTANYNVANLRSSVYVPTTLTVSNLADGASAIGNAGGAASNLSINGGVLKYTGGAANSSRLFTMGSQGATLDASGAGVLNLNNIGSLVQVEDAGLNNGTTTSGSTHVTGLTDITNLHEGMTVNGTGINPGTTIVAIVPRYNETSNLPNALAYSIYLSANATATGTVPLTFTNQDRTLTLTGSNTGDNNLSAVVSNSTNGKTGITKSGAGTWKLSGQNTHTGNTTVNAGVLKLGAGLKGTATDASALIVANGAKVEVLTSGNAASVTRVKSVNTNASGFIELNDNDMVIDYTGSSTNYTDTVNKVKSGLVLLGGTGTGIGSTIVDNQTVGGTMLAVVDDGDPNISGAITELSGYAIPNPTSSTLIKFTWFGDSNLDGVVDGSDYALIDTGFTSGGTLSGWVFGDYDYSGVVDASDYALIDTGFISQTGALPEPTTLGLLGLGAMGMLRRRRQA